MISHIGIFDEQKQSMDTGRVKQLMEKGKRQLTSTAIKVVLEKPK